MPLGSVLRAACCWMVISLGLTMGAPRPRVLHHPPFDPKATRVELFQAMEDGLVAARMRPRNEQQGSLFVENLSDNPLTVELPDVIVGVQTLPQLGLQFQFPNNSGDGLPQSGQSNGQGQGQTQPIAGTTSQGNSNSANSPIPFFSIPPGRVARIDYESVCLQYGATTPRSGSEYRPVRWDEVSDDQQLKSVLSQVGRSNASRRVLQAATWHLANSLSWEQLAAQRRKRINAPDEPYFQQHELEQARRLVVHAADQHGPESTAAAADDAKPPEPHPGIASR